MEDILSLVASAFCPACRGDRPLPTREDAIAHALAPSLWLSSLPACRLFACLLR